MSVLNIIDVNCIQKCHLQIVTRNVYVILDTKKDSDSVSVSD